MKTEEFLNNHSLKSLYELDKDSSAALYQNEGKAIIKESLNLVGEYSENTRKKCSICKRREMSKTLEKTAIVLSNLNMLMVKHRLKEQAEPCDIVLKQIQNCYTQNMYEIQRHDANVALSLSVFLGIVSIIVSLLSYLKPIEPKPESYVDREQIEARDTTQKAAEDSSARVFIIQAPQEESLKGDSLILSNQPTQL